MTYADLYNIRTATVTFNNVADALDGLLTQGYSSTTTGTSTAYIATPSPAWTSYVAGRTLAVVFHTACGASATINVSGLGAKSLFVNGAAIRSGDIATGDACLLVYDGTNFDVTNMTKMVLPPLYVDRPNSRVGVGISPGFNLQVEGTIRAGSGTVLGNYTIGLASGGTNTTRLTRYSGDNGTAEIRHQGTGGFQIVMEGASAFRVDTNSLMRFYIDSAGQVTIGDGSAGAPAISFINDPDNGMFRPTTNQLAFSVGGSEAVRLNSTGYVGIGTTSPAYALSVEGTSVAASAISTTRYQNDTSAAEIVIRKSRATVVGTNTTVNSADNIGTLSFLGADGTTYDSVGRVRVIAGTVAAGVIPGIMVLETANAAGALTERIRFKDDGEVLVAGNTDNGAYNLQCNGTGVWGAGAYVNGSDARIKEDVAPITDALSVIQKLNPVSFRYKESWSKDQAIQPGFIAQEVEVALNGMSYIDGIVQQGGEYLALAYQNFIPLLVKAIQELDAKVQALEAQ